MESAELQASLASTLAGEGRVDCQALNLACFWMTRVLDDLSFPVEEPRATARRLLRIVGRILVDTGREEATPDEWQEQTRPMVLLWLNETLAVLGYEAKPQAGSGQPEIQEPEAEWT